MFFKFSILSYRLTLLLVAVFGFLTAGSVLASTTNGTVSGYAWSSRIGWINFGNAGGNVHVTDSGLTGYAWNENTGRINLNPTNSGVLNSSGTLSGKAWAEGTGWIDFSGVSINSAGVFSGTATGDNSVTINFSCTQCNVSTDWRSPATRAAASSSGAGGSVAFGGGSILPKGSVVINNSASYTNNLKVLLSLQADTSVKNMAISNSPDFTDSVQESFASSKEWVLSMGDGKKSVYVKFYNSYGQSSAVLSSQIILDTKIPELKVTEFKSAYDQNEDVVVGGTGEVGALIDVVIDNKSSGQFSVDNNGNWFIALGKQALGKHSLVFSIQDLAFNKGEPLVISFSVTGQPATPPSFNLVPPLPPIVHEFLEGVTSLLPDWLINIEKKPTAVVTIPKAAPVALSGSVEYLSKKTLSTFVLAPLPKDIRVLAQKLPQVQKTFDQVGIQKITDVQKLTNTNLKLPTLTQTVTPKTDLALGSLAIKGIPVVKLSSVAKQKIPSEVLFVKGAGGLVDLNVALSVNRQGQVQQTIETISGHAIQLVLKVDQPVAKVTGYIVFKSKASIQPVANVPLNILAASLLFSNPTLSAPTKAATRVELEQSQDVSGSQLNTEVLRVTGNEGEGTTTEQRFVLGKFHYQDSGEGIYVADIQAPAVSGQYEIITVMDYLDSSIVSKEIRLTTVVDPEGYIYEKAGLQQTRVSGAIASLYWLNPETKKYQLWPAPDFQQENPQVTDVRGTYSFLVPQGHYYLSVEAPGYKPFQSKSFEVKEGSGVHMNIELKNEYWWLKFFDWKTILLIVVVLLLVYNFYRDKKREKISSSHLSEINHL